MRRVNTVIMIIIGWIAACAGNVAAEGSTVLLDSALGTPDIDIRVARTGLYKMQQSLSGTVARTEAGLALLTEYGVYTLRGISLGEHIGEEVSVTGIIGDGDEHKSIYVVKIDAGH